MNAYLTINLTLNFYIIQIIDILIFRCLNGSLSLNQSVLFFFCCNFYQYLGTRSISIPPLTFDVVN